MAAAVLGPPQPTFLATPCMPGLALRSLGTIRLVCGSPCTRRAKASGPSRPTTCMTHYQSKREPTCMRRSGITIILISDDKIVWGQDSASMMLNLR